VSEGPSCLKRYYSTKKARRLFAHKGMCFNAPRRGAGAAAGCIDLEVTLRSADPKYFYIQGFLIVQSSEDKSLSHHATNQSSYLPPRSKR
jgi:hypothetical protein